MIPGFVTNVILPRIIDNLGDKLGDKLFDKLGDGVISRARRWWTASDSSDYEAQRTKLRDSLKFIQSMINDAERKQGKESDDSVRLWLRDLQRLAYDAEDVVDECDYEHLRCRVETSGEKRKRSSFTSDILDKIKDINVRFDELKERACVLNLESREVRPTAMQLLKTDSLLGDSKVFGRGDDIKRILGILDDLREKQYLVSGISIVGMGGLGKTTVARSIYKKAKEEKHYDLVAWVCVSEDFNEETILREMHEHFKGGVPPRSINVLVEGLAKELEKKTFLLVLDDVWNKDGSRWNAFSNRLSRILKITRNSILVTTRDEDAWFLDQFGVLHNGKQPYPCAISTCMFPFINNFFLGLTVEKLATNGTEMVIIRNSSRRASTTMTKMKSLGFDPSFFEGAITSGELTHQYLQRFANFPVMVCAVEMSPSPFVIDAG
ncbi:hypothetical protein SLEP1_g16589 [Rubroshorea leprosula]|uniref:Disease resistance RPP13-like protein 1 n=1 Tax=Rubroshorea leprosula TaxID=152421 RepID=A0AAV5IXC6_9ROSI|nr:hypothetical protein SLEP1_g16589 [Rubroshorea leprosula]